MLVATDLGTSDLADMGVLRRGLDETIILRRAAVMGIAPGCASLYWCGGGVGLVDCCYRGNWSVPVIMLMRMGMGMTIVPVIAVIVCSRWFGFSLSGTGGLEDSRLGCFCFVGSLIRC